MSTKIEDGGAAFEKAVEARFAELKASGMLPLQRGRMASTRGTKHMAGQGTTIWERMGLRRS